MMGGDWEVMEPLSLDGENFSLAERLVDVEASLEPQDEYLGIEVDDELLRLLAESCMREESDTEDGAEGRRLESALLRQADEMMLREDSTPAAKLLAAMMVHILEQARGQRSFNPKSFQIIQRLHKGFAEYVPRTTDAAAGYVVMCARIYQEILESGQVLGSSYNAYGFSADKARDLLDQTRVSDANREGLRAKFFHFGQATTEDGHISQLFQPKEVKERFEQGMWRMQGEAENSSRGAEAKLWSLNQQGFRQAALRYEATLEYWNKGFEW